MSSIKVMSLKKRSESRLRRKCVFDDWLWMARSYSSCTHKVIPKLEVRFNIYYICTVFKMTQHNTIVYLQEALR